MSLGLTVVSFGEWLPDEPDLGSPGQLSRAENVVASADCYLPFEAFTPIAGSTLPGIAQGMFVTGYNAGAAIYAGGTDHLYSSDLSFTMVARSATLVPVTTYEWDFARFDQYVIATRSPLAPQLHTIGSGTNFVTLASTGTAPTGGFVGIINRFVMIGASDANGNPYVQWSALNDPRNWPTPNSATAIATQSGQQFLDPQYGDVYKITNGDQFGLIFQRRAITRVSYVGPPVVFQFDKIDSTNGLWWPTAAVQVQNIVYGLGMQGFYATDGVSITPIGAGKVNKTFVPNILGTVRAAYDERHNCVLWNYSTTSTTKSETALCLSLDANKWTKLDYGNLNNTVAVVSGMSPSSNSNQLGASVPTRTGPYFFDGNNVLNTFASAPTFANLRTSEMQLNPSGFSRINGAKPLVDGATAGALGIIVYSRNDLSASLAQGGSTRNPTDRDGFTHWRVEGRYHVVETSITGTFNKAIGVQVDARPTSEA